MNADTITCLNFIVHSLVIGAAAWLLVRFIIRDALRRCILANLAVLMCLYTPFNISIQDLLPAQPPVPVWTPIQETFKADWRITVTPAPAPPAVTTTKTPAWNVNEIVKVLRRLSWFITAVLLLRLALQSIGVQRWAWRLRNPSMDEHDKLPADLNPTRIRVFDHEGTPCVAGWFSPVIAVPASAFNKLTPHQWRWLLRHEGEHLRCHDTVCVFLQKIVRSFLWWNPFAHALIEEYARAREEACDAAAVGEERDHTAYADFLLEWASNSRPQAACVMPISHSRPARRLKVRLVALMEARGVRKKLGAFFVLACLAFAIIAPLLAASFGITTASAQVADDGTMKSRIYIVAPDFLGSPAVKTARELLEQKDVPFPPGASAIYQPATFQLIVRNTKTNIQMIEKIIDKLHTVPAMVNFTCKLIQSDQFLGAHESILSHEDAQELIRSVSQKKGVDLMSAPNLTTRFGQEAQVDAVSEILPKVLPNGELSGSLKLVGPSVKLLAQSPVQGKSTVETKVDLGVDPDSTTPWLPAKGKTVDWDKVRTYTIASKAALASGETLLLHLPAAKRCITVLITATALNLDGANAASFSATTLKAPPASQGRDMPKEQKKQEEWAVREYRIPSSFGNGRQPDAYLEACGVLFPPGATAELKNGKLTARNTKGNLDLIEALIESHLTAGLKNEGQVQLAVHAVDVKTDADGLMSLIFPEMKKEPGMEPSLIHQFTLQGVMTDPQFQVVLRNLSKNGNKPATLPSVMVKEGKEAVFDMPAEAGGSQLKVTPNIGPDGHTVEVTIQPASLDPASKQIITTGVTIWDGYTVMMAGSPAEKDKTMRVIFITATLIDPLGDPVKK